MIDAVIATQASSALPEFMARPFYIGMPSVTTAAGGRTFLAVGHIAHHPRAWDGLNTLVARNGYNGVVLWERKLPEGYLVHRSAFIATRDTFHMIDGDRCLLLDAATGEEKGRIQIPGVKGQSVEMDGDQRPGALCPGRQAGCRRYHHQRRPHPRRLELGGS